VSVGETQHVLRGIDGSGHGQAVQHAFRKGQLIVEMPHHAPQRLGQFAEFVAFDVHGAIPVAACAVRGEAHELVQRTHDGVAQGQNADQGDKHAQAQRCEAEQIGVFSGLFRAGSCRFLFVDEQDVRFMQPGQHGVQRGDGVPCQNVPRAVRIACLCGSGNFKRASVERRMRRIDFAQRLGKAGDNALGLLAFLTGIPLAEGAL